jgi:hypothetical protein
MTLLDRFRTQARDKHLDPAVRLAYVAELPLDDRATIAAIAREDEDPRVRRAAVAKLMDAAALGAIARDDADLTVQAAARTMLRDIALEALEGIAESDSLDAVDAIADPRTLTQIAKTSAREIVALRALSRIADAKSLGSIACHGAVEPVRRGAFERLRERDDRGEILAVAMNGAFKDTAVSAVDAIAAPEELEQIAAKSRNKNASKRARQIMRDAEEARARAEGEQADSHGGGSSGDETRDLKVGPTPDAGAEPVPEAESINAEQTAEAEAEERREEEARRRREEEAEREREERAAERAREAEERAKQDAERRARTTEAQDADQRERREALARVHNLLGRVETLLAKPDISLKAADRALRDVRNTLGSMPPLPGKQDVEDVTRRLRAAYAVLTPKVLELRDTDDWQRWANVSVQEQLSQKMEALRALDDPEAIAREVRVLQEQWRKAADVPRAQADALWRRFKAAHDEVWARCEAHFAAEAQARAENLAKKIALCEKAEALSESTRWIETADEIKRLQTDWKTIGPVPRGREKAIWDRFRAACDRFFTRRHEDLAERKKSWAENLAKKEALCVRAETLAESTDWEPAAAEIKRLQTEWKTIGPVKKTRSEAIWQRFRTACDRFFLRYSQRHEVVRAERVAAREAICAALETLAAIAPDEPAPADLPATVRTLRSRWQQEIGARGVDPERAQALDRRFAAAVSAVLTRWPAAFAGSELDPEANRKRLESLVKRVEDLASSVAGPTTAGDAALSPTARLAAMLKEALAANTIGGKADNDSRLRAALEDVRQAQASWSRVGAVPDEIRRPLADRFQQACRRIFDRAGDAGRTGQAGRAGGAGRAGR